MLESAVDGSTFEREWLQRTRDALEEGYLQGIHPWEGSGFFGSEERWELLRRPIAQPLVQSGSILDIGCANGYLLQCLYDWSSEFGVSLELYGIDILSSLLEQAQTRLKPLGAEIYEANGFTWVPTTQFDYVHTELLYVPNELRLEFIQRLRRIFLKTDGRLLVSEYRRRDSDLKEPWIDEFITTHSIPITNIFHGQDTDGVERSRVVVIRAE